MLIFRGTIDAKKSGSKEGREWATLQFIERDSRGVKVIDVYLPENCDHSSFVEGKAVELPVSVSANQGRIFYRATALNLASAASA